MDGKVLRSRVILKFQVKRDLALLRLNVARDTSRSGVPLKIAHKPTLRALASLIRLGK
jgi:hypothetical protein